MRWASAISRAQGLDRAVDEATASIASELGGEAPDLVFAFPSAEYSPAIDSLPERLSRALPGALVLGCSGGSIIGGGHEVEEGPALALAAASLPGVSLRGFHVDTAQLPGEVLDEGHWNERVGVEPEADPHFVLLSDPSADVEQLTRSLDARFPEAVKVGGIASGGDQPGSNALFLGDRVHRGGVVGVCLVGDVTVDAIIAQGCRPVGNPMFVTLCRDNVLHEVDGRPPLQVLNELVDGASPEDRALFQTSLLLGIEMRAEQTAYERGDFLIRNLVGGDPENGTLVVAAPLYATQVVQFHLRDRGTADADLEDRLARYQAATAPGGALLFSCLGRGQNFYREPDHDSNSFRRHLGEVPLTGFFCNGEIGPVQRRTFLHGYTSAFGIFRPKMAS